MAPSRMVFRVEHDSLQLEVGFPHESWPAGHVVLFAVVLSSMVLVLIRAHRRRVGADCSVLRAPAPADLPCDGLLRDRQGAEPARGGGCAQCHSESQQPDQG